MSITGRGAIEGLGDPASTAFPAISSSESSGGRSLVLQPRSADSSESSVSLNLQSPQAAGGGGGVLIRHNKNRTQALSQENVLRIDGEWTGDYTEGQGSSINQNSYAFVFGNIKGATTNEDYFVSGVNSGSRVSAGNYWSCFRAAGMVDGDAAARYVGFHSRVTQVAGTSAIGFYAEGNAQNILKDMYASSAATRHLTTTTLLALVGTSLLKALASTPITPPTVLNQRSGLTELVRRAAT